MLVGLLASVIAWVLDLALGGISAVIPQVAIDWLDEGAGAVAPLVQATPVTMVVSLVVAGYLVETAIDGMFFLMQTYKIIPFKAM